MKLYKIIFFIITALSNTRCSELSATIVKMDAHFSNSLVIVNERQTFFDQSEVPKVDTLPFGNVSESIVAISKAYGDSIVLRLAPTSYTVWESVRRNGFVVKKGNNVKDLKIISTVLPVTEDITKSPDFSKDSLAVAAAYIMYGKIDKSSLNGIYSLYETNENILGMSLLMAEFSAEAANTFGFRFVDKDVVKGQNYIYEISTKNFSGSEHIAMLEVKNELQNIKSPYEFEVLTGDGALELQWSMDYNKRNFTHYRIERSTDGKTYTSITPRPLLFSDADGHIRHQFNYSDSLDIINGTKYFYRLYGGNSFAEFSPPAQSAGTPRDLTPPSAPEIVKVDYNDQAYQFGIEWDTEIEAVPPDFSYYQVMMSRSDNGPYIAITKKLGLSDFNCIYDLGNNIAEDLEGRYFFRIDCYDESGNMSHSEYETSFVPDFTNPAPPQKLSGYVDSLSPKSTSKDVRGYWLYWGNSTNEELALVSKDILKDTSYQYYVPEKSLKKNLYYIVRAEDFAYNRSETSPMAKVRLLDKVPPGRPSIRNINTDSLVVKLYLGLSPSDDVYYHELYRRNAIGKDTSWLMLDTVWSGTDLVDGSAELNVSYQYRLRAVDSVGNKSIYSPFKSGILRINGNNTKISFFTAVQKSKSVQVDISWQVSIPEKMQKDVFSIEVFRSTGQDGVQFYKNLSMDQKSFSDPDLENGVLYNYALRVKYSNGQTSNLSEVKSILIK